MAQKRMFAKTIIDSDAFLDMSSSTQNLYFHLGMRADDDGFINNPKMIMRIINSSQDDLNVLILKKFILPLDNGIIVIKHWRINNYIQSDRYTPTKYQDELKKLELDENRAYTLKDDVYTLDTQVSKDKISLDKVSIDKSSKKKFTPPTLEQIEAYCIERNNNVDAKKFYEYFNAGNWVDSKGNKVKSWKQKILTWENMGNNKPKEVDRYKALKEF